jgi:hypothetical protein
VMPNPSPSIASLYGVSCASARSCTAVGDYATKSHVRQVLVQSWNGTAWSTVPSISTASPAPRPGRAKPSVSTPPTAALVPAMPSSSHGTAPPGRPELPAPRGGTSQHLLLEPGSRERHAPFVPWQKSRPVSKPTRLS